MFCEMPDQIRKKRSSTQVLTTNDTSVAISFEVFIRVKFIEHTKIICYILNPVYYKLANIVLVQISMHGEISNFFYHIQNLKHIQNAFKDEFSNLDDVAYRVTNTL